MNQHKREQIQSYAAAIAALLYEEAPQEQLQNLEDIEVAVRQQILEYVSPEIGRFLSKPTQGQTLVALEE